jgi:phasin
MNAMTENTFAAKPKSSKPSISQGVKPDQAVAEGTAAVREFAEKGAGYTKDVYEKSKGAAEETKKVMEQTYSSVAGAAADFNLQWIEMARANANSAFDFAREIAGVKSPSEFLELSAAHARKQFEAFTHQAQQLTSLAQKATTDAIHPLQAGVKNMYGKAVL